MGGVNDGERLGGLGLARDVDGSCLMGFFFVSSQRKLRNGEENKFPSNRHRSMFCHARNENSPFAAYLVLNCSVVVFGKHEPI